MVCVKNLIILNKKGLHARAASLFVKEAEKYTCNIWVEKEAQRVSAHSIMGLMMLAASKNSQIKVIAEGKDAKQALDGLSTLVEAKFFEEE